MQYIIKLFWETTIDVLTIWANVAWCIFSFIASSKSLNFDIWTTDYMSLDKAITEIKLRQLSPVPMYSLYLHDAARCNCDKSAGICNIAWAIIEWHTPQVMYAWHHAFSCTIACSWTLSSMAVIFICQCSTLHLISNVQVTAACTCPGAICSQIILLEL